MSVNRLTNNFDINNCDDYIIVNQSKDEVFILPDLSIVSDDKLLWHYLRNNGYKMIFFYSPNLGLYTWDNESIDILGLTKSTCQKTEEEVPDGFKTSGFHNEETLSEPDKSINENPNPEINSKLDEDGRYILGHDNLSFIELMKLTFKKKDIEKKALIFTQFDQTFTSTEEQSNSYLDLLRKNLSDWNNNKSVYVKTKFFFIYHNESCNNIINQILNKALFLSSTIDNEKQQFKKRSYLLFTKPEEDEISRLIHYFRLIRNFKTDWINIENVIKCLVAEKKNIKEWHSLFETLGIQNIGNGSKENNNIICIDNLVKNKFVTKETLIELGVEDKTIEINQEQIEKQLRYIKGQSEIISVITSDIKIWVKRKQRERPLSFFAVGTSGVGKTFTAECLQEAMKTSQFGYLELSMNEFSEEHRVSQLIGSPPGFEGGNVRPLLFEELKKTGRLIICFDEIEKAHKRIILTLMQLLDKGKLSWNNEVGDFRDCIIIFTSNLEREKVVKAKNNFVNLYRGDKQKALKSPELQKKIKDIFLRSEQKIPPELLGRITRYLVYNTLSAKDIIEIAIQEIQKLGKEFDLNITYISPHYLAQIARDYENSIYGVRDLRTDIQSEFLELITEYK